MNSTLLSDRYVNAFIRTLDQSSQALVLKELLIFCESFMSKIDQVNLALHPGLSPLQKASTLKTVVEKAGGSTPVAHFFYIVGLKNRIKLIPEFTASVEKRISEIDGQISARFVFATEVSDNIKQELLDQFKNITKKDVRPTYNIDPEILGGFQVFFDNKVLDGSVLKTIKSLVAKTEVA